VPLPIGAPRALRLGQWVIAAGSPYRLPRSFTVGIVSGLERSDVGTPNPYEDYIQTDAAVNVGSSGGPLLDASGRVVGVNTAILSRTLGNQGISFALPIDVVVPSFESIRATGRPPRRASVGASVRDLAAREGIAVPGGAGQVVTRVAEDSPARRAGLEEGDVIVAVAGVPTPSRGALLRTLWAQGAGGRPLPFDVWRRGQTFRATLTPIER
jgi:S1-C subfamily serine protease